MRRLLLALCISLAAGILSARYMDVSAGLLCLFSGAAALFVFWATGRRKNARFFRIAALCFAFFALGFTRMSFDKARSSELSAMDGCVAEIRGVAISARPDKGRASVLLDTGGEKVLIKLAADDADYIYSLVGRDCVCRGELRRPPGRRNPFCFDYAAYLKARGIGMVCEVSRFRFEAGAVKRPLLNFLSGLKGRFYKAAAVFMNDEELSLMSAIIFGDTGLLNPELLEQFRGNGTAHLLAVSGLHVSMVYSLVFRLLSGKRNRAASAATLLFLAAYAALADFSISVMRASLMIALRLLSVHIKRRYDSLTAASFAALLFLSTRPYLLFDAGFQLSFVAAYTLGACLPWTEAKMKAAADRFKNTAFQTIGRAAAPGLAVYLGTAPLMAFHFSVFSPLSLLINPPAVAVTGLLLAFGLGMFIIFAAMGQGILLAMAAGPAQLLCRALALLNDAGARARGGAAAAAPPLTALLLYYLFFFYFFSETRYILCRRGLRSIALSIGLSLAVLGCALPRALNLSNSLLPWKYCEYSAVFLDVGQGDCMHIRAGKRNILIDGGGLRGSNIAEKVLRPYLLKNGVSRIDLAIVTHSDLDHSLGIKQLGEIFPVDRIAFPDCYRLKEEKTEGYNTEELLFLGAGDELVLSENVSLRVLAPAKGAEASEEENDNSLVIMLYADGIRILLTGDLTQEGELALLDSLRTPKDGLRCDVLKLAHHGSAGSSSEAFMEAASPSFAVISCGMNNSHGHPAKRVVDLLEKSYIIYGRTDFCGALCLRTGGHGTIFIENAAKDAKWLIIKEKGQRNTRSEPWEL